MRKEEEVNGGVVGPGARWVCWGLNIQLREVDFINKYIQYLLDKKILLDTYQILIRLKKRHTYQIKTGELFKEIEQEKYRINK